MCLHNKYKLHCDEGFENAKKSPFLYFMFKIKCIKING